MDTKWLLVKVVAWEGCSDRWDAVSIITHHLRSFLGPFNMHSYAKSDILILILRRLYCTSRKFDLLASSQKCNSFFTWNNTTKQLPFLIVSSTPSLEKIAQLHNFEATLSGGISLFSPFSVWYIYLNLLMESSTQPPPPRPWCSRTCNLFTFGKAASWTASSSLISLLFSPLAADQQLS